MKKLLTLVFVTTIFVTSLAFAPLQAKSTINIHNNTESAIQVTLISEDDKYIVTVQPGWLQRKVESGTYGVKYTACGKDFVFDIDITTDNDVIDIKKCPGEIVLAKIVIESHLSDPIAVEFVSFDDLYGEDYKLTAEAGRNRFVDIKSGWYYYSYDACDTTFTGEFRVLKNGRGRLTMRSCERALLLEEGFSPTNTKLVIRSNFAPSFSVTLLGPVSKIVDVSTGSTRVDLPSGTYTYFYAVNGRRFSGLILVRSSGTSILNIAYFDYVTIPAE